jgi:hypothetical protein
LTTALAAGHHAELDDVGRAVLANAADSRPPGRRAGHRARRATGRHGRRRADHADRRSDLVRGFGFGRPVDDGFVHRTVDLVLAGHTAMTDAH